MVVLIGKLDQIGFQNKSLVNLVLLAWSRSLFLGCSLGRLLGRWMKVTKWWFLNLLQILKIVRLSKMKLSMEQEKLLEK